MVKSIIFIIKAEDCEDSDSKVKMHASMHKHQEFTKCDTAYYWNNNNCYACYLYNIIIIIILFILLIVNYTNRH